MSAFRVVVTEWAYYAALEGVLCLTTIFCLGTWEIEYLTDIIFVVFLFDFFWGGRKPWRGQCKKAQEGCRSRGM